MAGTGADWDGERDDKDRDRDRYVQAPGQGRGRGEGRQRGKMRGGRGEMDGGGWCGRLVWPGVGESDGCGRVVVVVVGMMST